MFTKLLLPVFFLLTALAAGCTPVAAPQAESGPAPAVERATETPEIFHPLDPSPTAPVSDLPLTCQVTDLNVFIDRPAGYCFAYPLDFTEGEPGQYGPTILGPARDDSAQPLQASLAVERHPVPPGSRLTPLADAFLSMFPDAPAPILRQPLAVAGSPAEVLEPVPGLGSARVVLFLHRETLFSLYFSPVGFADGAADLEALFQTVTGSFAFIAPPEEHALETASWFEFGESISIAYDPRLAPWVVPQTFPVVPFSDQILYAESRPASVQFLFFGFQGGRTYDLPVFPIENRVARVTVFRTADFPDFGADQAFGFPKQLLALQDLLTGGLDPARCAAPYAGEVDPLPFLPWINMGQAFCAQPLILDFPGGQGVRYLSYFSQGINPVLEGQVFYTFQGLTDDGRFYISALFPVATGIFPEIAPPCPRCGEADYNPVEELTALMADQLDRLNALPAGGFAPALETLDGVIRSIQIGP